MDALDPAYQEMLSAAGMRLPLPLMLLAHVGALG